MRDLNQKLSEHLENDVTSICQAWRVIRKDGVVLGFTDHDQDLTFDQTLFQCDSGFMPTNARSELGLNVDDQDVAGAFSSEQITEKDLADGRYDGAKVEVFLVNWQDVASYVKLRTQEIGEISYAQNAFRAELRSLAHQLEQTKGRVFSRRCGADLGDGACQVDLSNGLYHASGVVYSADDDQNIIVTGLSSFDEHWFSHGLITFQTGLNAGLSMEINDHTIDDNDSNHAHVRLFAPLANMPAANDQFSIITGCDKTHEHCQSKFNNMINFQGFPHMPGSDFTYGYADTETVHDGRPLVTT